MSLANSSRLGDPNFQYRPYSNLQPSLEIHSLRPRIIIGNHGAFLNGFCERCGQDRTSAILSRSSCVVKEAR